MKKTGRELKETWDILSDSWTDLRAWPEKAVIEFSESVDEGPVLDVGCGNCRNLIPFLKKDLKCVGIDFSKGMIKQSKKYLMGRNLSAGLVVADICNLPFKKGTFSTVLCVRTLHHVETRKSMLRSLNEIKRVGNIILISAWKRWQRKFIWKLIKSFFHGRFGDVHVNWNYHGKTYKRFYHLYTKKELEGNLKKVRFDIEKIWEDEKGNVWSVVK
jgi:ubiquinone/menaquinone biosynthesis C-methylase UbiE